MGNKVTFNGIDLDGFNFEITNAEYRAAHGDVTLVPTPTPTPTPTPVPVPVVVPAPVVVPVVAPEPKNTTGSINYGPGASTQLPGMEMHTQDLNETRAYTISAAQLLGGCKHTEIQLYEASFNLSIEINSQPWTFGVSPVKSETSHNRFVTFLAFVHDAEGAQYDVARLPPPDANGNYVINVRANPGDGSDQPAKYFLFYSPSNS